MLVCGGMTETSPVQFQKQLFAVLSQFTNKVNCEMISSKSDEKLLQVQQ